MLRFGLSPGRVAVNFSTPGQRILYDFSLDALTTAGTWQTELFQGIQDGVLVTSFSSGAAVPEPANWAMLISGFGLIGGMQRRRNARGRAQASA